MQKPALGSGDPDSIERANPKSRSNPGLHTPRSDYEQPYDNKRRPGTVGHAHPTRLTFACGLWTLDCGPWTFCLSSGDRGPRLYYPPHSHRLSNVLDRLLAQIFIRECHFVLDLVVDNTRDADASCLGQTF